MYDIEENRSFVACEFPLPLDGGRKALRLSSLVSLDDSSENNGAVSSWVHFAPFGIWKGHNQGTLSFTRESLEEIVDNFSKLANDLQVDYEHDSINKQLKGPKPAAGWIKRLEIRGDGSKPSDGLWAFVEWTRQAAMFIRNKEYKYTSPVIDSNAIDRKTNKKIGVELFNAALTNDPFLDGQVPLALERLPLQMEIKIKDKQESTSVAADQQNADQNAALQDEGMGGGSVVDKIAESLGMEPAAVEAIMLDRMDEIAAIVANYSQGEGTPADEATASATPQQSAVASDRWNKALENRVATLEREKAEERKKFILKHVKERIESGHIPDMDKDLATELYLENFDRAERIYGDQRIPLGRNQAKETKPAQGGIKLSDVEEQSVNGLVACGYSRKVATDRVVAQRKVN